MATSDAPGPARPPRPDLEGWLADPQVRTSYRRQARAEPLALWRAAAGVRVHDCRLLGRLVRARLGLDEPSMTFDALFRRPPFVLLDGGPTWALSGLCGRIWAMRGELGRLEGAEAFHGWDEPGTVRVLFAHWVEPHGHGSALCSEVRVSPVDRRAGLRLRALEPFIGAFQSLIVREPLALAVRTAQGAERSVQP